MWETDDNGKARDPWQLSNYLLHAGTKDEAQLYTFTTIVDRAA